VKLNGQDVKRRRPQHDHRSGDARGASRHAARARPRRLLGHGSLVTFRDPKIADLSKPRADNVAPEGFSALFDGRTLANWKGLVSPDRGVPGRAKLDAQAAEGRAGRRRPADARPLEGRGRALAYDGGGQSLCSAKDWKNFELWVDWKIAAKGDSGIYLRGSPQVQIWDNPIGSGGLYNNKKPENPSQPLVVADRPSASGTTSAS
jgi:hypothetical protein